MNDCENCIHADITYGRRVTQQGNVTLIQDGGMNITCTASGMNIDLRGDEMVCSGFEPRKVNYDKR